MRATRSVGRSLRNKPGKPLRLENFPAALFLPSRVPGRAELNDSRAHFLARLL